VLGPWFLALRVKTLTAAFVPVLVGTSLSMSLGTFSDYWISLYALLSAFCIQIATNVLNDAINFRKGADTETRIGPQRVTQRGWLSERQVWFMGLGFILLAATLGWPLVVRGGMPIVILGLVSLFLAYGYTGGPFPLAYLGLGDLFVILFFGLFAVGGTYYLQSLQWSAEALVAGLQVGFLSTILIAVNNLRDSESDQQVKKKTLAVRFGDSFVRWEIFALTVLTYGLNIYYLVFLQKIYVVISFALLPLGGLVVGLVFAVKDKRHLNKVLGVSALHQLLFAGFLSMGLVL
jgi:1,4-dihydroxy-2-naphthoate octaprenyltransferase